MSEPTKSELEKVLFNRFDVDIAPDYESLKNYLNNPNFPERGNIFKRELAETILNDRLSPENYEKLTNHDLETQEEVNEFLISEIWKPLYGDEPIQG